MRCETMDRRANTVVEVAFDELLEAFEFVGSAHPMENSAYLCLDTGRFYWTSELAAVDEDVPGDLETSERYIAIPHRKDLDLGKSLALRFVAQALPGGYEVAAGIFRRKGAYGRFKRLLESAGALDKWYRFEAECADRALRDSCERNGVRIRDRHAAPPA